MRYQVSHETRYDYDNPATLSQQLLHMSPRNFYAQKCLSHSIEITPNPYEFGSNLDYFGNNSQYFAIFTPHRSLHVRSNSTVMLQPRDNIDSMPQSPSWELVRDVLKINLPNQDAANMEAFAYLYPSPNVPCSAELVTYATPSFSPGRPLLEAALDLTQRIYREFEFDPHATDVATPLSEVLSVRRGVCQDFAHLMTGCLRSLGLPCRYVSGYIRSARPGDSSQAIGSDASHAWVGVYFPQYGWVDFDPTNNCLVQTEHVTVAWGRDYSDVSPMRGVVLGGGKQTLEVSVTVTPLGNF